MLRHERIVVQMRILALDARQLFGLPRTQALRRIEARGWYVSVHLLNDAVEVHGVRASVEPPAIHVARCHGGTGFSQQRRAAALLANAVGIEDVVDPD